MVNLTIVAVVWQCIDAGFGCAMGGYAKEYDFKLCSNYTLFLVTGPLLRMGQLTATQIARNILACRLPHRLLRS
jgi:hypothetical protein